MDTMILRQSPDYVGRELVVEIYERMPAESKLRLWLRDAMMFVMGGEWLVQNDIWLPEGFLQDQKVLLRGGHEFGEGLEPEYSLRDKYHV